MSDPIKNSKKRAKQLIGLEMSEKRIKNRDGSIAAKRKNKNKKTMEWFRWI